MNLLAKSEGCEPISSALYFPLKSIVVVEFELSRTSAREHSVSQNILDTSLMPY